MRYPLIIYIEVFFLIVWSFITFYTDEWFLFRFCGIVVAFFLGAEMMEHRIKHRIK